MNKTGILLINLGTPAASDKKSVRHYLREFLSDERVIDIAAPLRWILLNFFILPFRPKKSAKAYQQIWQHDGSPLLIYSQAQQRKLQMLLGENYHVELGMRYGKPTIAKALTNLNGCQRIIVLPLFPQYSAAATGSAIAKTLQHWQTQWNFPQIQIINYFYAHPAFIHAQADIIRKNVNLPDYDLLLFSYHGLPERHVKKSGCDPQCDYKQPCPIINNTNQYCYRAQCYATSELLAAELNLTKDQYQVAFQSRLGKTPWITPYTDLLLPMLATQGIKNIAIACPSFVADCLETLEEIGIRAREQWHQLGGQKLTLIPGLNDADVWIDALANILLLKEAGQQSCLASY